jgi:hypothetical protein
MRRMTEDFLVNKWQNGALLREKSEKAYFVKCDCSTMTQNDIDHGHLVCFIAVAPLKPAEFVIFRIGQWTDDRKVCALGAGEPSGARRSLSTAYAGWAPLISAAQETHALALLHFQSSKGQL